MPITILVTIMEAAEPNEDGDDMLINLKVVPEGENQKEITYGAVMVEHVLRGMKELGVDIRYTAGGMDGFSFEDLDRNEPVH